MSNFIKIERFKIEKIIKDYMLKSPVVSIEELTDKIWKYIEETMSKVKYPVTIRKDYEELGKEKINANN